MSYIIQVVNLYGYTVINSLGRLIFWHRLCFFFLLGKNNAALRMIDSDRWGSRCFGPLQLAHSAPCYLFIFRNKALVFFVTVMWVPAVCVYSVTVRPGYS